MQQIGTLRPWLILNAAPMVEIRCDGNDPKRVRARLMFGGSEVAKENFLEGVAIVSIEDILTYEEIERERNRLFDFAPALTVKEIRLAGARIADALIRGDFDLRERALLQLRGQTAMEIYEAMLNNVIRPSRMKRIARISIGVGASDEAIQEFTQVEVTRPKWK